MTGSTKMASTTTRTPGALRAYGLCSALLLVASASAAPPTVGQPSRPDLGAQTRHFIGNQRVLLHRDARGMSELRRALSARFYRSLSLAFEEDRRSQTEHPEEKPGHIEFTFICADGSFDGHEIVSTTFHSASSASVVVSFHDLDSGSTYRWKDRYAWVREQGVWRIDDIECEINDPDRRQSLRRAIGH